MKLAEDPCWVGATAIHCGSQLKSAPGPQIYGVAYCPAAFSDKLRTLGFAGKQVFQVNYALTQMLHRHR